MPLYGGQRISWKMKQGVGHSTLALILPPKPQFSIGYRFIGSGHAMGEPNEEILDMNGRRIGEVLINMMMEDESRKSDIAIGMFDEDVPVDQLNPMWIGWKVPVRGERQVAGFGNPPARGTQVEMVGAETGHHVFTIDQQTDVMRGVIIDKVIMAMEHVGNGQPPVEGDSGGPVFHDDKLIGVYVGDFVLNGRHLYGFTHIGALNQYL